MANIRVQVGNDGAYFGAMCRDSSGPLDISGASAKEIHVQKPDGTYAVYTASFYIDGTDGKILYQTRAGDIDQAGLWKIQAFVTFDGATIRSNVVKFRVYPNLPLG